MYELLSDQTPACGHKVGDRDLLEGISWRLMPGHRVGLVGANGAGKSTLLRCLTGVRQVGDQPGPVWEDRLSCFTSWQLLMKQWSCALWKHVVP